MASEHLFGPWEAEAGLGSIKTSSAARKGEAGQSTSVLCFYFSRVDCDKQEKRFREADPSKSG